MEMPMARIETIDAGFYRIPLPVILSDSTHGEIKAFELLTLRVRDSDGAEGVGYTYTVGRNGGAIADILRREIPDLIKGREADDTEAIWQHVWWGLHYGGRGGPVVLPEGAPREAAALASPRRLRSPRALLCRRYRPRSLGRGPTETDRRQFEQRLSRHQDEGGSARPRLRRRARARDAQASRRRLCADGGCQYEMDGGGGHPGGAGIAALRSVLARGANHSR